MKNKLRFAIVLAILIILYTVCYFAIPYPHKDTTVFALTYVFAVVAFASQGYTFYVSFCKKDTLKSKVYGLPIFRVGIIYLAVALLTSIIITVANAFVAVPLWIAIILPVLLLGFAVIGCITTEAVKEEIERQDNKIVYDTHFIDNLKTEFKSLLVTFNYEPLKAKFNKLCDSISYSDPVSNESLILIEDEMDKNYILLKDALYNKDYVELEKQIDKLLLLVNERSARCKSSK